MSAEIGEPLDGGCSQPRGRLASDRKRRSTVIQERETGLLAPHALLLRSPRGCTFLAVTAWIALLAIALCAVSGFATLLSHKRSVNGQRAACAILTSGAVLGLLASLRTLLGVEPSRALDLPWPVPGGRVSVEVDEISAVFLVQIFLLGLLNSIYGLRYWRQSEHEEDGRKLNCFYGLTVAGMALLVIARNAVLFLVGWEGMAISAFFLVSTEDRQPEVRQAGYIYIVATRFGTLALIAMFALLASASGKLAFEAPPSTTSSTVLDAIFLLALFGFGIKAGMMPMHVWLPPAHANAPSHISALMSGVLIKMGIYGLVRLISFFSSPPLWWGVTILLLGIISGVLGVAFALAQHDLKRLLAYHSVENIGIILIGLGLATMGRSLHRADLVLLGICGALLHVINHGLFKALLFLSGGAVVHSTGTRAIDRLGGLARSMPRTTICFLIGAVAICGLPPLNGFISELFIYLGLFHGAVPGTDFLQLVGVAFAASSLALIGALAVACFVKVFGAVFLGAPRSELAAGAHDPPTAMAIPQAVLALLCAVIGLVPISVAPMLERAASTFAPETSGLVGPLYALSDAVPLEILSIVGAFLAALLWFLSLILRMAITRHPVARGPTWGCGYVAPSARMQYTASSFADMLVRFFSAVLRPKTHRPSALELFPKQAHFESHVGDVVLDSLVAPAFEAFARLFSWFRWMQRGSVHVYLLYILITILLLHFIG
jgi:hydrogenase-4 component B